MSNILDNQFLPGTGGYAPEGGFLPTPQLTKLGPNSDILHDMFISGTGGIAPSGGVRPAPPLTKSEQTYVIPQLT